MDDIGLEHECLGQQLKIWSDHYSCLLETKGGGLPANFDWFIVTSQYKIEEIFKRRRHKRPFSEDSRFTTSWTSLYA